MPYSKREEHPFSRKGRPDLKPPRLWPKQDRAKQNPRVREFGGFGIITGSHVDARTGGR